MLSNRFVEIHLYGQSSRKYNLNDGLPQGSVLAPLLFNTDISDLPTTISRKFIYADDTALVCQNTNFQWSKDDFSSELGKKNTYQK